VMLLTGSRTLAELRRGKHFIGRDLTAWLTNVPG